MSTVKKVQAASGLLFGAFLFLHLLTHFTLNLGYDEADERLHSFRVIYQNPIFEIMLLVTVLAHVYANISIYTHRQKIERHAHKGEDKSKQHQVAGNLELKAHRIAGYVLAFSIVGHVAATRLGPMFILEDPSVYDYSFVAKVNDLLPGQFFLIYLAVFGMAAGWHMIYGTRSAISTLRGSSVLGKPFPMLLKVLALANHILIVGAVLALGGFRYAIDTETKAELHDKLFSTMGMH